MTAYRDKRSSHVDEKLEERSSLVPPVVRHCVIVRSDPTARELIMRAFSETAVARGYLFAGFLALTCSHGFPHELPAGHERLYCFATGTQEEAQAESAALGRRLWEKCQAASCERPEEATVH